MHTTIALAVAALTVSACTPTVPVAVTSVPPVRHVEVERLPDQPMHDANASAIRPDAAAPDPTDPVAIAIQRIVVGLDAEGLEILDVGAETITVEERRVTVRVEVTHRIDQATTPYTSVYDLDLTRVGDGTWVVTDGRTVS